MNKKLSWAYVLIALLSERCSADLPPLDSVTTSSSNRIAIPQGYVSGVSILTDSNVRVKAYLGIPYALPPVGDLRFAPPERHTGWNRTLFAGHFRPDCTQLRPEPRSESDLTNEDCLYLNVFVPEAAMSYRNYPVLVFVHGHDYVGGSPLAVNAEELAKEGLIVVTFSYRLNVFGFLTFEDEFARGNLGLLDQYMAFLWVKDNIQYFGGVPGNVTLMGHGAGASSVLVHMTSPRTKNLFQRVILMSGSILSPWLRSHPRSESHPALKTSRAIARSLGCYGESYVGQKSASVLFCLRQKTSEEILRAFESAYMNGNWSHPLGPISDDFLSGGNQYLPLDPTDAIKRGKFHKVPIMTGITSNEGTLSLHNWRDLIGQSEETIEHFIRNTAVANILENYRFTGPEIRNLVTWNYLDKIPSNRKLIHQLVELYNDAVYRAPFWLQTEVLSKHNEGNPLFVYVFAQPGPDYIGNYVDLLNLTGSGHGSDLVSLFGPTIFQRVPKKRLTINEERLKAKMKRLFAYFVRLGHPTPPSYGYNIWNEYTKHQQNYLNFHVDQETGQALEIISGVPDREPFTLWNSLLPQLEELNEKRTKKMEELLVLAGASNGGTESRLCGSYKSAMFTTLAFLILLLVMLILSLLFLKKRTKERDECIL